MELPSSRPSVAPATVKRVFILTSMACYLIFCHLLVRSTARRPLAPSPHPAFHRPIFASPHATRVCATSLLSVPLDSALFDPFAMPLTRSLRR